MANLFSGLESLGLGKMSDMNVFEKKEEENEEHSVEKHIVTEDELIFDKTFMCPVCDHEFKAKAVKTGKAKLVSQDTDLRPRYQPFDTLKYDAIVCGSCGYAALSKFFNTIVAAQVKLVKENISNNFRGIPEPGNTYSYDDAITRHKLALANAVVKKAKLSEKAYICLKIAWLLRGKAESLPKDAPDREKVKAALAAEEKEFLENAYQGFMDAFSKESFPLCGMDENTVTYLLADIARRNGKYEESLRWASKVIVARDASDRIKERARHIKDLTMVAMGRKAPTE